MADQVGRLGALRSPASPRPIRNRNPKTSPFLSPATQQQFVAPPPPPAALSPALPSLQRRSSSSQRRLQLPSLKHRRCSCPPPLQRRRCSCPPPLGQPLYRQNSHYIGKSTTSRLTYRLVTKSVPCRLDSTYRLENLGRMYLTFERITSVETCSIF
jgi:hypothetical protein